jgi:hypothetical protein
MSSSGARFLAGSGSLSSGVLGSSGALSSGSFGSSSSANAVVASEVSCPFDDKPEGRCAAASKAAGAGEKFFASDNSSRLATLCSGGFRSS